VIGSGGRIVYLHASIRGLFDECGPLTRTIGVVADITRSKKAEAALRESEQRFKLFMPMHGTDATLRVSLPRLPRMERIRSDNIGSAHWGCHWRSRARSLGSISRSFF
jgi:PAS domain-containing protein